MQDKLSQLHLSTNNLLNWLLQPKSICLGKQPKYETDKILDQMLNAYECINIPHDKALDVSIEKINEQDYQSEYTLPIIRIQEFVEENLREYIVDFILHGSMATLDYVSGWSDLDSTIVVKNSTLQDFEKMQKFREKCMELSDKFLYKIDPFQHHGILYLTEYDLQNYVDIFLPAELYKNSKTLLRKQNLKFLIRDSKTEQLVRLKSIRKTFLDARDGGVLWHHPYYGVYLHENYKNADDAMYQFKYLLSVVMLLPSLFMNLRGVNCEKKDSFELSKQFISSENWDIIERASNVRFFWNERLNNNKIPSWVKEIVGYGYFEKSFNLVDEMLLKIK